MIVNRSTGAIVRTQAEKDLEAKLRAERLAALKSGTTIEIDKSTKTKRVPKESKPKEQKYIRGGENHGKTLGGLSRSYDEKIDPERLVNFDLAKTAGIMAKEISELEAAKMSIPETSVGKLRKIQGKIDQHIDQAIQESGCSGTAIAIASKNNDARARLYKALSDLKDFKRQHLPVNPQDAEDMSKFADKTYLTPHIVNGDVQKNELGEVIYVEKNILSTLRELEDNLLNARNYFNEVVG